MENQGEQIAGETPEVMEFDLDEDALAGYWAFPRFMPFNNSATATWFGSFLLNPMVVTKAFLDDPGGENRL